MSEQAGSTSNGSKMVGPREVVVRGNAEGFTQEIVVGPHQLTADEPEDMGGDDEGPTPYDLLLAALGSCTSITVTMYAQNKSWPLQDVTVRLLIYWEYRSEPPRTRTWNLEIKSLYRRVSDRCSRLQNPLKSAESTSSSLPNVSCCCSGLVSKLVSVTVSLATARVRQGPQNSFLYHCL
jgi:uncharacterized OsmC-like protein